jgi:hypothetical protein
MNEDTYETLIKNREWDSILKPFLVNNLKKILQLIENNYYPDKENIFKIFNIMNYSPHLLFFTSS